MMPMDAVHYEDMFLDLSQSLHRCRASCSERVPCITPQSRLWKRRAKEWLLAPEAMLAQGLDSGYVRHLKMFSRRQIIDLMGNAFNAASSYLVALATAFAFADASTADDSCPGCDSGQVQSGSGGVLSNDVADLWGMALDDLDNAEAAPAAAGSDDSESD